MALVLHGGGSTSGDPVDRVSVGLWKDGGLSVNVGLWDVTVHLGELLVAPVGELVVAGNPGVSFVAVDGLDSVFSNGEKCLSEFEFLDGAVGFSVASDEFHELGRKLGGRCDSSEGEDSEGLHN